MSQQSQSQVREAQHVSIGAAERQKLGELPWARRAAFYEQVLVQHSPIRISPQGEFCGLEGRLNSMWQLTIPTHEHGSLAAEAAQVFYSRNEFMLSVGIVPGFVAWHVGSSFRPSDLITRLAVHFGPSQDPGGGNGELLPLLSMPHLQSVRMVYEDYAVKGFGPYYYLRPSFGVVMELRKKVQLTLQLKDAWRGASVDEEESANESLKDITSYLTPPTLADMQTVYAGKKALEGYRGFSASVANSLMECGWTEAASEEFIVLRWRAMIMEWANEYPVASQDVEMS